MPAGSAAKSGCAGIEQVDAAADVREVYIADGRRDETEGVGSIEQAVARERHLGVPGLKRRLRWQPARGRWHGEQAGARREGLRRIVFGRRHERHGRIATGEELVGGDRPVAAAGPEVFEARPLRRQVAQRRRRGGRHGIVEQLVFVEPERLDHDHLGRREVPARGRRAQTAGRQHEVASPGRRARKRERLARIAGQGGMNGTTSGGRQRQFRIRRTPQAPWGPRRRAPLDGAAARPV